MEQAVVTETPRFNSTLFFKDRAALDVSHSRTCRVAGMRMPRKMFEGTVSREGKLTLNRWWRLEDGMRIPAGESRLHHVVSSVHPKEKRRFFIPTELVVDLNW